MTESEAQALLRHEAAVFWLHFLVVAAVVAALAYAFRRQLAGAIDRFGERHGLVAWADEDPDPDDLPRGYHVRPEHVFVDELADWPPPAS